jgi:large subunit ribosomal protein L3
MCGQHPQQFTPIRTTLQSVQCEDIMANEKAGLYGRKLGMTQIYSEDGAVQPCTIIEVTGNTVLRVKTADSKDGYNAVQLGFDEKSEARTNKPDAGNFEKSGVTPKKLVREIRLGADDISTLAVGQVLSASDIFTEGQLVDVTGTSKGRGFTGVMKRHNFKGFIRSHGTHEYFRHGGSIGTRLTPGHVIKGKKMPGQHGNARSCVQNLVLVKIDNERNLLYVRGGVPGPNGGYVMVRKAVKAKN